MINGLQSWLRQGWEGWNRFWFTPQDAATLAIVRICGGAMLLYTHLVWGLAFNDFFGAKSWIHQSLAAELQADPFAWSHFFWTDNTLLLRIAHLVALVSFALLTLGIYTKLAAIVSMLAAISYVHRLPGALFGLDQLNVLLATYLAVGDSGRTYSIDAYLARRSGKPLDANTIPNNIALRLIQLHMCVIYMFAGMGKLQGPAWWNGEAFWGAVAIQEYQSMDMTWLVHYPSVIALLTYVTVYWELFYVALVWPTWSRPVMLLLAIPLHLGIAICLGMVTFGLIMIVGNFAFVPAIWVRQCMAYLLGQRSVNAKPSSGTTISGMNTSRGQVA